MTEKKSKEAPPKKQYYTIKIETLAPVEFTCKVLAESANEAAELVTKGSFAKYITGQSKPSANKAKKIKATVFRFGTIVVDFIKRF